MRCSRQRLRTALFPSRPVCSPPGYVQISGAGVYPGLQVTDSQG